MVTQTYEVSQCAGTRHDFGDANWAPRQYRQTVEEMTPKDVQQRRARQIQTLRNDIERYKKYIVAARAEIKLWENL